MLTMRAVETIRIVRAHSISEKPLLLLILFFIFLPFFMTPSILYCNRDAKKMSPKTPFYHFYVYLKKEI